jgi:hypothetical protein
MKNIACAILAVGFLWIGGKANDKNIPDVLAKLGVLLIALIAAVAVFRY